MTIEKKLLSKVSRLLSLTESEEFKAFIRYLEVSQVGGKPIKRTTKGFPKSRDQLVLDKHILAMHHSDSWLRRMPDLTMDQIRYLYFMEMLRRSGYNRTYAAASTGIGLRTVRQWIGILKGMGFDIPESGTPTEK